MSFTLGQLIEGRDEPVCVPHNTSIKDALTNMIDNKFSQLPVVDESGNLMGLINEHELICLHYQLGGRNLLAEELTVGRYCIPAKALSSDNDLIDALDDLSQTGCVIVVEGNKPVGIITDYDTASFLREFSESLMLVQDIELTLRDRIESAFPNGQVSKAALFHAFGPHKRWQDQPAQKYEELTLKEHVQLITTEENWPKFEAMFKPKPYFNDLMGSVIDTRNQIAHFRGNITPLQLDGLQRALNFLNRCPRLEQNTATIPVEFTVVEEAAQGTETIVVNKNGSAGVRIKRRGKYDPLASWLRSQDPTQTEFRIAFSDIEKIVGQPLPPASERRHWWANDHTKHSQSIAWLGAGWRVKAADLQNHIVTFERIKAGSNASEDEGTL